MPSAPGQPEPPGDHVGHLDRGGGHQPDPLAGVQVQPGQRMRARPDLVGDDLVVDLFADRGELGDRVAGDEGQGRLADLVQVLQVLAERDEPGLLPSHPADVAAGEELAPVEPRARWKMLAPRTTVLSTSKKAAAVGSGGTAMASSTCAIAPVTASRVVAARGPA